MVSKLDDHKYWKFFIKIANKLNNTSNTFEFWIIGGITVSSKVNRGFSIRSK